MVDGFEVTVTEHGWRIRPASGPDDPQPDPQVTEPLHAQLDRALQALETGTADEGPVRRLIAALVHAGVHPFEVTTRHRLAYSDVRACLDPAGPESADTGSAETGSADTDTGAADAGPEDSGQGASGPVR